MDIALLPRPELPVRSPPEAPSPLLRLRLIGTMEATGPAGESVLPPGRKTRALLAIVALAAPRPVSRARLADLLWGRRPELQARASLRQEIHRLSEALEPLHREVLQVTRDHLGLWPGLVWTDVGELRVADAADTASLALMSGTLLDGLDGAESALDSWLNAEREKLSDHVRALAELRLGAQVEPGATIAAARQLLAIDRAHEGAWRALMRAYAGRGERGMAIEAYERCRAALSLARHATPSAETDALLAELCRVDAAASGTTGAGGAAGQAGRPRVGVMPMQPIGGADPELGMAITNEITSALTRLSGICLAGLPARPYEVGGALRADFSARRRLGIDLVIEGTLQKSGRQLRVLLRLLDRRDGDHVLWTRRFDGQADDCLGLQDEVAAGTAAELEGLVALVEGRRAALGNAAEQQAPELLLRAVPMMLRLEPNRFREAGRLLREAHVREPASARNAAWYALWHAFHVSQAWAPDPVAAAASAGALAEKAIRLDPTDAQVLAIAGQIRAGLGRRPREALELFDRALARNPNQAMAWALSGLAFVYLGALNEADRQLDRYKVLSPLDPHAGLLDLGLVASALLRRDHARAAVLGRQAGELTPGFAGVLQLFLAALGHLGRRQEAALVQRRLLAISPAFTVARFVATSPFSSAADTEHIASGLTLAGVPRGA